MTIVTAIATLLAVSPAGLTYNMNLAYAGGHHHDDDEDGNNASQIIAQVQRNIQKSQVVSGGDTEDSGNNINF